MKQNENNIREEITFEKITLNPFMKSIKTKEIKGFHRWLNLVESAA